MRRGKAERAGRAAQRRESLQHGPGALDDHLDNEVEANRHRAEDPRHQPVLASIGIRNREDDPDRQPDPPVLADPPEALGDRLDPAAVTAGAHRVEQPAIEAGEHGGGG